MRNVRKLLIVLLLLISNVIAGAQDDSASRVIYLFGEYHYSKKDIDFKQKMVGKAAQKEIVFALEGVCRDPQHEKNMMELFKKRGLGDISTGYFYGIDDLFVKFWVNLLDLNNLLNAINLRNVILSDLESTAVMNKKYDIIMTLLSVEMYDFLSIFDGVKLSGNLILDYLLLNKDLVYQPILDQKKIVKPRIDEWNNSDWIDFTGLLASELIQELKERIKNERFQVADFLLSCVYDFELDTDCDQSNTIYDESLGIYISRYMKELHLTIRDDFMIDNIEKIFALAEEKKVPLVCILGDHHVKGIKAHLESRGHTVIIDQMFKDEF